MMFSEWRTRLIFMLVLLWTLEIKQCVQYIRKNLVKINNVGLIKFFFYLHLAFGLIFYCRNHNVWEFFNHSYHQHLYHQNSFKTKKTLLIIYIIMWCSICVSSTIETVGCNIFRLFIVTTPTLSSMEIAGIICNGDVLWYILNNFRGIYKWWT